jgi:hypothetical protein
MSRESATHDREEGEEMSKFGVWAWQTGEGCDYMIGCGSVLIELEATKREDAIKEALEVLIERGYTVGSEQELREAQVVEFIHEIDINDIEEEPEPVDEAKEARRRDYETLKREFG